MSKDTKDIKSDKVKDQVVETYLKGACEHMLAAGRSAREFSEFTLEKFGEPFRPYLRKFLADVGEGRVKVKGMTKAAKASLLGAHATPQERIELIRIAAYVRAERRGFFGGSPEQDWLEAEREIDAQLSQDVGLVGKGHKALTAANALIEKELDSIKDSITSWLEGTIPVKPETKKKTAKKKPAAMATD